jgi:hypothetical protein
MTGCKITMASGAVYYVNSEEGERVLQAVLGTRGAYAQWVTDGADHKVYFAIRNVESDEPAVLPEPIVTAAEEQIPVTAAASNGHMD